MNILSLICSVSQCIIIFCPVRVTVDSSFMYPQIIMSARILFKISPHSQILFGCQSYVHYKNEIQKITTNIRRDIEMTFNPWPYLQSNNMNNGKGTAISESVMFTLLECVCLYHTDSQNAMFLWNHSGTDKIAKLHFQRFRSKE